MRPWELAAQWQQKHSPVSFEQVLGWHLSRGYVWSTPDVFMVAREECYDAATGEFCVGEPNCWFVELAAGRAGLPVREFMRVAPYPHRWVAWCRRNEPRVKAFEWGKLSKKVRL
jgi:hypothetical protein